MLNTPGVNEFIDLSDTPNSYLGQATKVTKVKATEDGLEFADQGTGGGGTATQVEINFGNIENPILSWSISDSGVTNTSIVVINLSSNPATGRKGNDWELDSCFFTTSASSGNFTLIANPSTKMVGYRNIYYQVLQ